MGVRILSAGKGEGKTTFLCGYVAEAADRGQSVGGIASPAVFETGRRLGYDLLDLRRGTRRPLARVTTVPGALPTAESCGLYEFDAEAVKQGNTAILAAVRERFDVIAIDEVGPLEFRGGGWAPALETALKECDSRQELVITVRPSLLDELSDRFPSSLWADAVRVSPPWPDDCGTGFQPVSGTG